MPIKKLKQQLSGRLIRNIGWLGGAEFLNRIFRLGTTVVIARALSHYDYGLIAIVSTINDFAFIFCLRGGIGAKIIQADEKDVKVLCNTAYWLNWILCGSLCLIESLAAFPIAWVYGDNRVILPICVVALVYLIQPVYDIQGALLQRENRLNIMALCNATQSMLGNILSISLALLGMGIWAVVLPSLLTAPLYIVFNYRNHPWRPPKYFTLERWQEIVNFGKTILGVELLNKLRANLDYLLVGRFLGVEALGLYYFAFNAGLGISLNMMGIVWVALFPHLCASRGDLKQLKEQYFKSLKMIALIFVPLVLLQSSLAQFYVPIIFGHKWVTAVPILVLICLSALPRAFASTASQLLYVVDKNHIDFYWNIIFTVIFAIVLLVAVRWGVYWVAASVFICHALMLPVFTILVIRYIFTQKPYSSIVKGKS